MGNDNNRGRQDLGAKNRGMIEAVLLVAVVLVTGYLVGMVASEQVRVWWDAVSPMGGA